MLSEKPKTFALACKGKKPENPGRQRRKKSHQKKTEKRTIRKVQNREEKSFKERKNKQENTARKVGN